MPKARTPIEDRFWPKVDKRGPDDCWLWNSTKNEHGYGLIGAGGKYGGMILAHRFSWELHRGDIPEGHCALHKCDTPACVNPGHLFLGTRADNNADMEAKGRAVKVGSPGEKNAASKLTADDVLAIRRDYVPGKVTQTTLADRYGVHVSLISLVITRKAWAHI